MVEDETAQAVDGDGLWLTISDIAKNKGISKQALSRRVARLEEEGSLRSRHGPRGTKLVHVATLDRLIEETTDFGRTHAARAASPAAPLRSLGDPGFIYTHEQARRAAYEADLKKLELDERLGEVLPIAELVNAANVTGEAIVRVLEGLPACTDEIMVIARTGDRFALQKLLRDIIFRIRTLLAEEMDRLREKDRTAEP